MNALRAEPTARDLLCAILAAGSLSRPLQAGEPDALWALADHHRVDTLLAAVICRSSGSSSEILDEAAKRLAGAKLVAALRAEEVRRLLEAMMVDALILKGVGLGYTVYPAPYVRPSRDLDLFIPHGAIAQAERALLSCGYKRQHEADTQLTSSQRHYTRVDASRLHHFVDLHWRVANPRVFADAISFDRAWSSALSVPMLGPRARTLDYPDALLLACIHRVAHHRDSTHLLWLWDIHLLAGQLTSEQWNRFIGDAERSQMRGVSARGLALARARFGTRIPGPVIDRLDDSAGNESAAQFIGGSLRLIDVLYADLTAMSSSWRDRIVLMREHLFPTRTYMRGRYRRWPAPLLPVAYFHRILSGVPKWLRRDPLDPDP